MQSGPPSSSAALTEATTDITLFVENEMPEDVRATLDNYIPLNANDDTVLLLRATFKYIPPDGRLHLADDIIQAGIDGRLHQLAQSIITGLLLPMKVAGGKSTDITPSPPLGIEESMENLASMHMTDEPITHDQNRLSLRENALLRDGDKCVITGHYNVLSDSDADGMTSRLEAAHIMPFALGRFQNDYERQRMVAVWANILHYFPNVRSRLNFYYENINSMENVMMLSNYLHDEFGSFRLALEPTGNTNEYRVKTFRRFPTFCQAFLPVNGVITMTAHDERFPLPSPILFQLHCAIANILHATGQGEKIDRVLRDYDDTARLASDESTNISQLLSVKLPFLPMTCEQ